MGSIWVPFLEPKVIKRGPKRGLEKGLKKVSILGPVLGPFWGSIWEPGGAELAVVIHMAPQSLQRVILGPQKGRFGTDLGSILRLILIFVEAHLTSVT